MAKPELLQSISLLSKKIDNLRNQNLLLQEKVQDLENANNNLVKRHEKDKELLANAEKQIEFLSMSHRLAASPEALISARDKISKLIRTLDNCIRMINED